MSEKSYVGMAYKVCPITNEEWETGELLLDRRMKDSLEKKTIVGYGFCPEVQEKLDQGYVALVEIDPDKSGDATILRQTMKMEDAYKTGRVAYLRKQIAKDMLGITTKMSYIDPKMFEHLIELEQKIEDDVDKKEGTSD